MAPGNLRLETQWKLTRMVEFLLSVTFACGLVVAGDIVVAHSARTNGS